MSGLRTSEAYAFLLHHGGMLLVGVTVLLFLGVLAVALSRTPIARQRAGEWTMAGVLLWFAAAWVPMPRWNLGAGEGVAASHAPVAQVPADRLPRVAAEPAVAGPLAKVAVEAEVAEPAPVGPALVVPAVDRTGARFAAEPLRLPAASAPVTDPRPSPRTTAPAVTEGAFLRRPLDAAAPLPALRPVAWDELALDAYLAGLAACLLLLVLSSVVLAWILNTARPAPGWIQELADELSSGRRPTPILVHGLVRRPFCVALFRPRVLLPEELCSPRHAAVLRSVLLHELAHVSQRDGRGHALFLLAQPLLFAHPLYWWLRSRVRLAAELVADDIAASVAGRGAYATELIQLAERQSGRGIVPLAAHTAFRNPSDFTRRIEMLMKRRGRLATRLSPARRLVQGTAASAALLATVALFGAPPAMGQHAAVQQDELASLRAQRRDLMMRIEQLQAELADLQASRVDEYTRPPTARLGYTEVIVGEGDTLEKIVREHAAPGITADDMLRYNKGLDPGRLMPGQKLRLPPPPVPAATLPSPAAAPMDPFGVPAAQAPRPSASPFGSTPRKPSQPGPAGPARFTRPEPAPEPVLNARTAPAAEPVLRARTAPAAEPVLRARTAPAAEPVLNARTAPAAEPAAPARPARTPSDPIFAESVPEPRANTLSGYTLEIPAPGPVLEAATLDLVTRAIELEGQVNVAEHELARSRALAEKNVLSDTDLLRAETNLVTVRRSTDLVRNLIKAEVRTAELDIHNAQRTLEVAEQTKNELLISRAKRELLRCDSRLSILRSAL